jgi:hypothetical protein
MLDRLWHPDLTQEEAVQLMEKGIEEVTYSPCRVLSSYKAVHRIATVHMPMCLQLFEEVLPRIVGSPHLKGFVE